MNAFQYSIPNNLYINICSMMLQQRALLSKRTAQSEIKGWLPTMADTAAVAGGTRALITEQQIEKQEQDYRVVLCKRKFSDFQVHRLLGAGTFGEVYLAQISQQNHGGALAPVTPASPVAIKVLNKRRVIEEGQVTNALAEKNIMRELEHPFITNL